MRARSIAVTILSAALLANCTSNAATSDAFSLTTSFACGASTCASTDLCVEQYYGSGFDPDAGPFPAPSFACQSRPMACTTCDCVSQADPSLGQGYGCMCAQTPDGHLEVTCSPI